MKNILAKIPKRKIKTIGIISGIVIFTLLASGIIAAFVDHEKKIPYITINGFAENEEDYDPAVTLLLNTNEEALSLIDSEFDLLGVWQQLGTPSLPAMSFDGYNEPQPETRTSFEVQSILIFQTEKEAIAALDLIFTYYATNGYASPSEDADSASPYKRTAQIEANNAKDYEQAEQQYNAGPDILVPMAATKNSDKAFNLELSTNVLDKILGVPAVQPIQGEYVKEKIGKAQAFIGTRSYDSSGNYLPEEERTYTINLVNSLGDLKLANLPKFEGNFKFNSEFKPEWTWVENSQDGLPCPLEPNSVVGGWLPHYGCPPN